MILADTRHRLTRDDAQLAARLLATRERTMTRATLESRIADEGIDAILDDPRLAGALLRQPRGAHASFTLFAYVMVRQALRRAGEDDRGVADYVSAIVLNFGFRDRAHRIAMTDDELYDAIVELCEDLDDPDARRSFLVRTHLGNYALWLSGIFPDYIEQRRWRRGGPDLEYYEEMGRRGFQLAADHRLAEEHGLSGAVRERRRPFRHSAHGAQLGERYAVLSVRALARAVDAPGRATKRGGGASKPR